MFKDTTEQKLVFVTFAGQEQTEAEVSGCFWRRRRGAGWRERCERSCGGMQQRGYQFVEGFLCPISSVRGHVPRVLTLVTSLALCLPGDPGPGVFITYCHASPHPINTQTPSLLPPQSKNLHMKVNKSPKVTPRPECMY